jgi:hypothetical protein
MAVTLTVIVAMFVTVTVAVWLRRGNGAGGSLRSDRLTVVSATRFVRVSVHRRKSYSTRLLAEVKIELLA